MFSVPLILNICKGFLESEAKLLKARLYLIRQFVSSVKQAGDIARVGERCREMVNEATQVSFTLLNFS